MSLSRTLCCCGGGESCEDRLDLVGDIVLDSDSCIEDDDEEDVASAGWCEYCRKSLAGWGVCCVDVGFTDVELVWVDSDGWYDWDCRVEVEDTDGLEKADVDVDIELDAAVGL